MSDSHRPMLDEYEKMTWRTPSDELADAVENLLKEVRRRNREIQQVRDWARECISLDENAVLECFYAIDHRPLRGGPHRLCFCDAPQEWKE